MRRKRKNNGDKDLNVFLKGLIKGFIFGEGILEEKGLTNQNWLGLYAVGEREVKLKQKYTRKE